MLLTLSRKDNIVEPYDVSELDDHEVEMEVREGVTSHDSGWRVEHVEVVHSWDVSSDIETCGGNGGVSDWGSPSRL